MELANRKTSCNPFIVYVYHFCWTTQFWVKITSKLLILNFYNELLEVYGNAMDGFKTYLYTEPPRPNLTPKHTQTKPWFYFRGLLWVCFFENLRPLGDILDEHCGLQRKTLELLYIHRFLRIAQAQYSNWKQNNNTI